MNSPAISAPLSSSSSTFCFPSHSKPTTTTTTTTTLLPIKTLTLFPSFKSTQITTTTTAHALNPNPNPVTLPSPELPPKSRLHHLISQFETLTTPLQRLTHLLHTYSTLLPPFPTSLRTPSNRVMGCTSRVWLHASLDPHGRVRFLADSDSHVSKALCACLVSVLDGALPHEVAQFKVDDLAQLHFGGGNNNSWYNNVLVSMQKKCKGLVLERDHGVVGFEEYCFPSLVVDLDGVTPKGSYAEAQARYLFPSESQVNQLVQILKEKKIGIVAHFYMDPEVQGVLTAAQKQWPHIHISDSLVMADSAVKMAEDGCQFIAVLGVDFMSENVRSILDQAGFNKVGVYRMSNERIGCSLADAAATPDYMNYLDSASLSSSPSLHVIYINTSLETKAHAHELVPTITCTSSNVVQTILQAFAQIPDLTVYYGPDSYMGANIAELFQQMTLMTDEEISAIHPQHSRDSIKSLLPRLQYFQDGTCMVHDLFGHEVVEKINEMYCDAYLTAHFEVPGEMFSLAMEAKRRGMGVVGSTQNILDFIKQKLQEALERNIDDHLKFVLGTESGMITSIVANVRNMLSSVKTSSKRADISVEIVFPVSSDSVSTTRRNSNSAGVEDSLNITVVPGVASGEGCSIHGGCASCPYMKMNSLSALLQICRNLPDEKHVLLAYEARRFSSQTLSGRSVADVGCEPILHMRHFQAKKELPDKLVQQILRSSENRKPSS